MATRTVWARSNAEVPVLMPVRASIGAVHGVPWASTFLPGSGSRCSRSQMAADSDSPRMPQPLRTMKLIASGVTFSAAMTRSPSFSRFSSSTSTIIRPARSSSRASSIRQNPSVVVVGMTVPQAHGPQRRTAGVSRLVQDQPADAGRSLKRRPADRSASLFYRA